MRNHLRHLSRGHVAAWLLAAVAAVIALVAAMPVAAAPAAPAAAPSAHAPVAAAPAWPAGSRPAAVAPRRQHPSKPPRRASTGARPTTRTYQVRPGDSLSSIAARLGGPSAGWSWLYQANRSRISDPGLIYPGQVLTVPPVPPRPSQPVVSAYRPPARSPGGYGHRPTPPASHYQASPDGTLGCAGLEALWEQAGGPASRAVTAASIAMAESGGRQYATGTAGERGYWQVHPDHGSLSTYDPYGNARAAVIISVGGTNWTPWTTYTSGAYAGRC